MTTRRTTQAALRAALQKEDAAIRKRLPDAPEPESKPVPGAKPAQSSTRRGSSRPRSGSVSASAQLEQAQPAQAEPTLAGSKQGGPKQGGPKQGGLEAGKSTVESETTSEAVTALRDGFASAIGAGGKTGRKRGRKHATEIEAKREKVEKPRSAKKEPSTPPKPRRCKRVKLELALSEDDKARIDTLRARLQHADATGPEASDSGSTRPEEGKGKKKAGKKPPASKEKRISRSDIVRLGIARLVSCSDDSGDAELATLLKTLPRLKGKGG